MHSKKWKEVRPTTLQKMCALEGMHSNNASTRTTGQKMLTRLFFFEKFCLEPLPPPPLPPVPRNRLAQEPPPGSAVEFFHHFFLTTVLGFS